MQEKNTTTIIRHKRENLKKCSLQPLVGRNDLIFLTYPLRSPLAIREKTIILTMDAPLLSFEDRDHDLLLIDATWILAGDIEKNLAPQLLSFPRRTLPSIRTAYPRRQTGCSDPERGLASIEALYIAYQILGRSTEGLLNHYHWKEEFLKYSSPSEDAS